MSAGAKLRRCDASADVADHAGAENDIRERNVEYEDGHERRPGDAPKNGVRERARTDAVGGEQNDGGDRRLDAVQDAGDRR
jgi:hypothetical protein